MLHVPCHISAPPIQVLLLGYFIHISITTPIASAFKNYYFKSLLEAPADVLNQKPLFDPGSRFNN
jgi:hypothetical protein